MYCVRYFQKTLMSLSTAKESVRIDRISYKVQVKNKRRQSKVTQELNFFLCQTLEAKVQFCSPILYCCIFHFNKEKETEMKQIKGGARKVSDRGDRCSEVWQSLNNSELGSTPVTQQSVITCVWKSRKMTFIQNVHREKLSHWETHFTMPLYQRNFVTQFERV